MCEGYLKVWHWKALTQDISLCGLCAGKKAQVRLSCLHTPCGKTRERSEGSLRIRKDNPSLLQIDRCADTVGPGCTTRIGRQALSHRIAAERSMRSMLGHRVGSFSAAGPSLRVLHGQRLSSYAA
jgi:hypothetical protein